MQCRASVNHTLHCKTRKTKPASLHEDQFKEQMNPTDSVELFLFTYSKPISADRHLLLKLSQDANECLAYCRSNNHVTLLLVSRELSVAIVQSVKLQHHLASDATHA